MLPTITSARTPFAVGLAVLLETVVAVVVAGAAVTVTVLGAVRGCPDVLVAQPAVAMVSVSSPAITVLVRMSFPLQFCLTGGDVTPGHRLITGDCDEDHVESGQPIGAPHVLNW
ncbi:hypothetical protein GCM10029964_038240 [Kibdelosporangium lantanae]